MNHSHFLVASCLCLFLTACAEETDDIDSIEQSIVGGQQTQGDPAVVALHAEWVANGQRSAALCTGSLIAPRVILTAAHCLDRIGTPDVHFAYFGADYNALLNPERNDPTAIATIDIVEFDYDRQFTDVPTESLYDGHDIGLVRLAQDAPVTPIAINRVPLEGLVGNPVRLAGFGVDEEGDGGIKREANAFLDDASGVLAFYGTQLANRPYTNTCSGDSGGPTFMNVEGREVIVGITSFGDNDCAQLGASTRVDRYAQTFIDPFLAGAPTCSNDGVCDSGCSTPDPDCAGEVPEQEGASNTASGGATAVTGGCTAGNVGGSSSFIVLLGLIGWTRRRRHRGLKSPS